MTVEACDPNNKGGSYDNPGIPEAQADYISGISTLRFYFIRMLELEQGAMNGWNLAAVHGMRVVTRRGCLWRPLFWRRNTVRKRPWFLN
ncbi:MAG: hypothetical protein VYA69_08390 [Gemmatimonadota bacterium]|nr:hypothetical protein [Gemmatimonadota bacterium]